ncbi:hypothetical protein R3P38DRAFT_2857553 [Favolaschia claudopus]|uniref:F-box domain-containing protein n=1 Tax=Favolaschia claudopus TaxID=2862362 RepID=A0AAW0DGB3_9AGAR
MSALPPELDDFIVGHLYDDKEALLSCSLVNISFLRSSRTRLFNKVALNAYNSKVFLELVASPLQTFLHCIEDLTIAHSSFATELLPELPVFSSTKTLHMHYPHANMGSDGTLTQMPVVFPQVLDLEILSSYSYCPLRESIRFTGCLTKLRGLSITSALLEEDASAFNAPVPPELEVLRIEARHGSGDPFPQVVDWLTASSPPSNLRALTLGLLQRGSLPTVSKLITVLGPQLVALDLDLEYRLTATDIERHLDLSQNINLHDLTIHIGLRRYHAPGSSYPHAPWALLTAPKAPCSIKSLTIYLRIDFSEMLQNFDWDRFNSLLESGSQYSALERLQWIVYCPSGNITPAITSRLPVWAKKGILNVSVNTGRASTSGLHTLRFAH